MDRDSEMNKTRKHNLFGGKTRRSTEGWVGSFRLCFSGGSTPEGFRRDESYLTKDEILMYHGISQYWVLCSSKRRICVSISS